MVLRELSIFVDESGDFGPYQVHSPYYVLGLVLHDQREDITGNLNLIHEALMARGFQADHPIHSGPLIRREHDYAWMSISERRSLFRTLFSFARDCGVRQKAWTFDKRVIGTGEELELEMAKTLGSFIRDNLIYFQSQDRIIVYYDNGQKEVTRVLNIVLSAMLLNVEFRRVSPSKYSLFQVADLCCTLELLRTKLVAKALSSSERDFFQTPKASADRALKKIYIAGYYQMQFKSDL